MFLHRRCAVIVDGLSYRTFEFSESRCHLVEVDLTKLSIRPVLAAEQFPFLRETPVVDAIEQGSLASVGGGFNTVWYHNLGYADQPLHALVVDREIWTTGTPGGGYGVLIGKHRARLQQNRIQVNVWRPDHTVIGVDHINRGNDGKVVAFTPRGGTNQYPREGKHYAALGFPSAWVDEGESMHRAMFVLRVSKFDPIEVEPDTIVLEGRWPLKLREGDEVTWVQRLGAPGVRYVVSGATGIIQDGVNRVPFLNMDPTAPHGPDNWYVRRNPRMILGASEDGRTAFICVVEGRVEGSKGLRLKQAATMLLKHGVWGAVNMDGGGSAFLWMRDGGLLADSTYGDKTLEGLRPDHYSVSVFLE